MEQEPSQLKSTLKIKEPSSHISETGHNSDPHTPSKEISPDEVKIEQKLSISFESLLSDNKFMPNFKEFLKKVELFSEENTLAQGLFGQMEALY